MPTFAPKRNRTREPDSSCLAHPNYSKVREGYHPQRVVHLQRAIGNQAVQRILGAEEARGTSATAPQQLAVNGGPAAAFPLPSVANNQPLTIGEPGDAFEREADRVSGQVMRAPSPAGLHPSPAAAGQLGQADSAGTAARSAPANAFGGIGPGQQLDAATRAFFEPHFGQDFSGVRVHSGAQAAEAARAVNARAFTVGRDVVFDSGEFSPGTQAGRKLLAHELAHVGQQSGGAQAMLQRDPKTPDAPPGGNFTPADYTALLKSKKDLTISADSTYLGAAKTARQHFEHVAVCARREALALGDGGD
jgi:hypothetical protein